MCSIFRRRRVAAAGPFAIAGLWISATLEVLWNATAVHWEILRQDLRYTIRTLSRARGFALTTIVLVAIGVGANTAAFSVTDFVLVRPLPYPDSSSLVRAWQQEVGGYSSMEFSPANYRDWRRLTRSFERTGAFYTSAVNVVARGEPERVDMAAVTADLLPALGVQPAMGRLFTAADDQEGAPRRVDSQRRPVAACVRRRSIGRGYARDARRRRVHDRGRDAGALQLPHARRGDVAAGATSRPGVRGSQRQPSRSGWPGSSPA